jgi:hypothetical protein
VDNSKIIRVGGRVKNIELSYDERHSILLIDHNISRLTLREQHEKGTQFKGAERELREMIQGWSEEQLKIYRAENGMKWKFITPLAPHQNGCAESLVKTCKTTLQHAIGSQVLTPFELYTYLMEVMNLVNQ